jgi:hypothetical protein
VKAKIGDREFALTKSPYTGNRLPKRGGEVSLVVDGAPVKAVTTTNKGWAKSPELVLDYIWIEVSGVAYYLTLNYAEPAASLAGSEVETSEGAGPKPVVRKTSDEKVEAERVARFKATWTARRVVAA